MYQDLKKVQFNCHLSRIIRTYLALNSGSVDCLLLFKMQMRGLANNSGCVLNALTFSLNVGFRMQQRTRLRDERDVSPTTYVGRMEM